MDHKTPLPSIEKCTNTHLGRPPASLNGERQNRYQQFVDHAADGCYETDLDGVFTFFNNGFCRIFARSRKEIENHHFRDFMDAENGYSAADIFNELDSTDTSAQLVWKIVHPEGEERILEVSAQPIFDGQGNHFGFGGMVRDVTDTIHDREAFIQSKKRVQQLYKESIKAEQRYRSFTKFLPLPLMVQDLDFNIVYTNPAFNGTFGWTTEDLKQNPMAHIPFDVQSITKSSQLRLRQTGEISDLETRCLTKDGRILDVIVDASILYDRDDSACTVITLRDATRAKKDATNAQSLFAIAEALHHYNDLDSLLSFISQMIQNLLGVRHAHIILIDEEKEEYYFKAGQVEEPESYQVFSESRVALDDSYFAGQVITSGQPRFINDVANTNIKFVIPKDRLHNILGVPMKLGHSICGAMVGGNKVDGDFTDEDIVLLKSIAGMVSLPIENTRINDELRQSYEEIKSLNRAKDRIIEHLSHELRTPLSILSASLGMLAGKEYPGPDKLTRILDRSQRNLKRLMDMQAKISDITRDTDSYVPQPIKTLLDLCTDVLEAIAEIEDGQNASQAVRKGIDSFSKPQDMQLQHIHLGSFVAKEIEILRPLIAHRQLDISVHIEGDDCSVNLPPDVLKKIIYGLCRNAVEHTPDGGQIRVYVREFAGKAEFVVEDTGVGITRENQQLIFGHYFTTADISSYGTGTPFGFNAGGSGFDLLRLQVFSEQYHFKITMHSQRCCHIPANEDICPGSTETCSYCDSEKHCQETGGTSFTIQFDSRETIDGPTHHDSSSTI